MICIDLGEKSHAALRSVLMCQYGQSGYIDISIVSKTKIVIIFDFDPKKSPIIISHRNGTHWFVMNVSKRT